jgi:hypothetical protein
MKAQILKWNKKPSAQGSHFYYVFLKGEDGKSYRTCVYPHYNNFSRWQPYIDKTGIWLDNLRLKSEKLIDADSEFRRVLT